MLAQAIAHDDEIQDAFVDGVLWVTLDKNLTAIITDLIKTMNDKCPMDHSAELVLQGLEADQSAARDVWLPPKPRADPAVSHSHKTTPIGSTIDAASITSPERRLLGLWPPDP
jgi:hypothetical protein